MFNIRIHELNSENCNSVDSHFSAVTVEPHTGWYLNFCTKKDTKLVHHAQQSMVVVHEPLSAAPCPACRISFLSDQENLRNCAQLALTSLITQITLQYKQQKRSTTLIVTIVFDITACNNKISNNNKREVWITNRLGGCFLLIFMFFFWFFHSVFFSWFLYYFLFGFLYIFGGPKYFWSHTAQGSTESRNRPTFVIREFLVLTRLKNKTREYGRLPRSEIPFRPWAKGLI